MRFLVMLDVRMMGSGADRTADAARILPRCRQQSSNRHQAATAIGSATKASIGLRRRARPLALFGIERGEDLGVGQHITGTNDHAWTSAVTVIDLRPGNGNCCALNTSLEPIKTTDLSYT